MPVLPGSPPIDIALRRSARSRRFSLRVNRLDGRVTLTLPLRAREADALAFAATQEDWLRRAISGLPVVAVVTFGTLLPVEGQMLRIVPGQARAVRVVGDQLEVPGGSEQVGRRVAAFLRALARNRLAAASDRYAGVLGRRVVRLTLRDPRSRWGSCTAQGALMYSWRLAMAPPAVLDYVAAHEVAHLIEMNHSAAFWAVVTRLRPDWKTQRDWLRGPGAGLQGYRFGD